MPKNRSGRCGYNQIDSPFYKLQSVKKLAVLLRTSVRTLEIIANSREKYTRKWKNKENDNWIQYEPRREAANDYRPIDIPDPRLKGIQGRIWNLLSRISLPAHLFYPVKGRSYVDNAAHHRGARAFWCLDIADYFPSCGANNIARFFNRDLQCAPDVTAILVKLTTHNGCLPQGSPCSPILAYFANQPMWTEIAAVVSDSDCKLSIYADDITISGEMIPKATIWKIKKIVNRHGMRLKPSKEVSLIHKPADITGVIVHGTKILLPNRKHAALAKIIAEQNATGDLSIRKRFDAKIAGRIAQRRQIEGG